MLLLQHAESPPLQWPRDSLPFWQFISQLLLQTAYLSLLKAGHNMFEAASVDAASLAAILPGLQRKWHHTFRVADARVQLEVRETLYHLSLSLSLSLWLRRRSYNKQKHAKNMVCTFGSTFLMISCQMPPCHWKLNDSFCRLVATSSSENSADSLLNDLFLHSLLRWQPAKEQVCNSNKGPRTFCMAVDWLQL